MRLVRPRSLTVPRGPGERLLAWLYTGPLGHLYGVLADITEMSIRYAAAKRRTRA